MKKIEFSPEMRLLLSCCCKETGETHRVDISKMIQEGPDWDEFIRLVNYHQVLPIVYVNLREQAAESVPSRVLNRLKTRCQKQKIHSLKLTAELVRIVKLCREEGIDIICLKGPVLALQLYRDVAMRQIIDIDLLVEHRDIKKVHQLLIRSGYETGHPELFSSPLHWKVFKKSKHHIPYHHKKELLNLELHFRLFKNLHVFPNSKLNARDNIQPVVYAGVTLDTLSAVDNTIFLFVHGSIHKWHQVKWLTDMVQLVRSQSIDWEELFARAVEMGLDRPVFQGLLLLNRLFAIPLPGIFSQIPVSKPVKKLTHHALRVIDESRETSKYGLFFAARERIYLLKLKRGVRYKLRYLRDLFYLDSHRNILRLPGFLFPFYIVLNPFLWFYKNYIGKEGGRGQSGKTLP
jgi:hypothetical protein